MKFWTGSCELDDLEIRQVSRLDDLGALPPEAGSLYQAGRWLALAEKGSRGAVRYVAAVDPAGAVIGIVPIYLLDPRVLGPYNPAKALGLAVPLEGPVAVLAGMWGYFSRWSLAAGCDQTRVLAALLAASSAAAEEAGAASMAGLYLPPGEVELACRTGLVEAAEFVVHSGAVTIHLPAGGFEGGYLPSLSGRRRHMIRRELGQFERSGLRLRTCLLSEAMDFAPRLMGAVQERHGHRGSEDQMRVLLAAMLDSLDDLSVTIVAERPDRTPVAYSTSFAYGDTLYVRFVGIDYEAAEPAAAYFVTTYYAPIRHAYRACLRAVHVGSGSLRPKVLRGGELIPLYGFLRTESGAVPLAQRAAAAAARMNSLKAQLNDLSSAVADVDPIFTRRPVHCSGGTTTAG